MKQNLHIQSELILNHIELTDLDLSELPPYPIIEDKKVQPRFVGIVCRCRSLDNYAFVVTNMYGFNKTSTPYSPVQLYLEKSQWKDTAYLKGVVSKKVCKLDIILIFALSNKKQQEYGTYTRTNFGNYFELHK